MVQDMQTSKSIGTERARPIVLVFTTFYLPGYRGGGPIRSIANLVERLSDDFEFCIFTMDRDLHDAQPYQGVNVDAWNTVGKARVFYASASMRTLAGTIRLLRETRYDVLYLNSFFDRKFTLLPLLASRLRLVRRRPIILAPRGEFSAGAFRLKFWKKGPFTKLAKFVGLYSEVIWHASTELEASDIRHAQGERGVSIAVARNVSVAPDLTDVFPANMSFVEGARVRDDNSFHVVFLSRISPMKNLDFALEVLARVKVPVRFTIFGPQEDPTYWAGCQKLIAQMPRHVAVTYGGSIQHDQVRATLAKFDLFFLPTRGENFGHVFLEAWSAGVPVLVSDQTPWRGLESLQVGWDVPLDDPEQFVRTLELAARLDIGERVQMRKCCIEFARERSDDAEALELNRNLFSAALRKA